MPDLIQHFQEHQQWDKDISFTTFLYMHYVEDDHGYADDERDMQMPFKIVSNNAMSIFSFIIPATQYFITQEIFFETQLRKLYQHDFFYSSSFQTNIWQPPRNC